MSRRAAVLAPPVLAAACVFGIVFAQTAQAAWPGGNGKIVFVRADFQTGTEHIYSMDATVVYPTGQYPADVNDIQAAIDRGGLVLLKATNTSGAPTAFNFGPPAPGSGFVKFHRDAELVGERASGAVTTIDGGFAPVRGFDAITTAVRNIVFEAPLQFALYFTGPPQADTEITRNRILHVVGRFFPPLGFTTGAAIYVSGGRFVIEDNIVSDVAADFGQGIAEGDAAGRVEIRGNRITGTSGYAIESTQLSSPSQGSIKIEDNVLRPGSLANGFPESGIALNGTGSYTVARNDVLIESPFGIGIGVVGAPGFGLGPVTAPVIEHNSIALQPVRDIGGSLFDDGIDLAGQVSHASVRNNRIEGVGYSAFSVYDVAPDGGPSDLGFNTFAGNKITQMQAQFADVFLDVAAHDTVFKGECRSVIDLGTNNQVTCSHRGGRARADRKTSAVESRAPSTVAATQALQNALLRP
jgi:hypothetical protein